MATVEYVNNINTKIKEKNSSYCQMFKYTHNMSILRFNPILLMLQRDSDSVNDWCTLNRMSLVVNKCVVISFNKNIHKVTFNCSIINHVIARETSTY